MNGIQENRAERLRRLALQDERSHQAAEDDRAAFHAEIRRAREENRSYQWIAEAIGKSRTQTFRIVNRLTGPER